ncbi:MAG: AAA family ATPase, partial [Candidatus Electrothrix sp. ATG2]|nr:AAA family ATPase [Candidatus Electrothrix sp. ATG2]
GEKTAVEVKSSANISDRDFKGLKFLAEEKVFTQYILVSQDPVNRRNGDMYAMHWQDFLDALWAGTFLG